MRTCGQMDEKHFPSWPGVSKGSSGQVAVHSLPPNTKTPSCLKPQPSSAEEAKAKLKKLRQRDAKNWQLEAQTQVLTAANDKTETWSCKTCTFQNPAGLYVHVESKWLIPVTKFAYNDETKQCNCCPKAPQVPSPQLAAFPAVARHRTKRNFA